MMNQQWRYFHQHYPYAQQQVPYAGNGYHMNPYIQMPSNHPKEGMNQEQKKGKEMTPQQCNTVTITEHIEKMNEKLSKMEEENKQMKEKIENINPVNVENINYKIQDLHVEDLSGTLLVGLAALSDAEKLQELLTENGPLSFNDINTDEYENNMMTNEGADDSNHNNND